MHPLSGVFLKGLPDDLINSEKKKRLTFAVISSISSVVWISPKVKSMWRIFECTNISRRD